MTAIILLKSTWIGFQRARQKAIDCASCRSKDVARSNLHDENHFEFKTVLRSLGRGFDDVGELVEGNQEVLSAMAPLVELGLVGRAQKEFVGNDHMSPRH